MPRWAQWFPEDEIEAHAMNAARPGRTRDILLRDQPATGSLEESVQEDARWEGNDADLETEEDSE